MNKISMAIYFDREGIYNEEFPSINSPDANKTWQNSDLLIETSTH